MTKTCLPIILLLILIIIGGLYKYVLQDVVSPGSDGRELIQLNADEKDFVLAEMRLFLSSTQQIIQGIAEDDMELVAIQATKSGKDVQLTVPVALAKKLPAPFKKLGFDTHTKFDQIAMDAKDLGDSEHALSQLAALLQNCTSCHDAYRF